MILRSKEGSQTIAIPNRWVDNEGNIYEYPADLKTLLVEFVDTSAKTKLSTITEFIKVGD